MTPSGSPRASGKTTCAFFRPGSDGDIEFASTHADPKSKQLQDEENAFRASGKERRYSWDYDPEMDIYVYGGRTGTLTRLTTARGYDAEGSYSPDGQWIVFTSMRDAYNRTLTDAEKKQLETDPSYFAEIYIMKADGSGQKRLTNVAGYDGGPFFTHDGSRIVWRRFDVTGRHRRRLDDEAGRQRPAADHGFRRDELGALRASVRPLLHLRVEQARVRQLRAVHGRRGGHEGAGARHLLTDGFDGLPVPSPDGKQLAWTSSRAGGSAGQLFLAQWNHEKALEALAQAPPKKAAKKP